MTPLARLLPGERLHLQHGPSDLIIWAEGAREQAYKAATNRFQTIITEIVEELSPLREMLSPLSTRPKGAVARRMHEACLPLTDLGYLTRMAAVAGAVADEVLDAMRAGANIRRAYVNNGGDIALHLDPDTSFVTAMKGHDGSDLGRITLTAGDGVGGIATSGRHGRSLSLGLADSVTALATSAARADVAATLIANAVDLPGHPAVTRRPACEVDDASDLSDLAVVTSCGPLDAQGRSRALAAGVDRAELLLSRGCITSAGLFLQGQYCTLGPCLPATSKDPIHVQA